MRMLWFTALLLLNHCCLAQELQVLRTTYLPGFSSASSIEISNNRLYIAGDDAPSILIVDTGHQVLDSFPLVKTKQKRINKETKADLESSFLLEKDTISSLVVIGSFSTPARNRIYTFQLQQNGRLRLKKSQSPFFDRKGIAEVNIEGATHVKENIILSNRANTTHKVNQLVITRMNETGLQLSGFRLIGFLLPLQNKVIGISGLYYLEEEDILFFSASTEDTPNAYTDGAIGESYIGYIRRFSSHLDKRSVRADKLVPLSPYLGQETPQKIESIAAEPCTGGPLIVHLAADNDNGTSTLYKLQWRL